MTSESFIYDPAHWRTRADEARILAKELDDSESRDAMLRMAQDYERLAQWVEDRALRGASTEELRIHQIEGLHGHLYSAAACDSDFRNWFSVEFPNRLKAAFDADN